MNFKPLQKAKMFIVDEQYDLLLMFLYTYKYSS